MNAGLEPWIYQVKPYSGESFSHYLGRFRRENIMTVSRLGEETGLGGVLIKRLEHFYLNPFPKIEQLQPLAEFMGLSPEALLAMLPPPGQGFKLEPIRLCGACYEVEPFHRLEWQFKDTAGCERHRLRLLSECPRCKARFQIPALWEGRCQRCGMGFGDMQAFQKPY